MKMKVLKEAGIDYEEGVNRFVNHTALYERFLKEFALKNDFHILEDCMNKKDYDNALAVAHSLKGLTGNLSLNRLYSCLSLLVDYLRQDSSILVAEEMFPNIQKIYNTTIEAIKNCFIV